MKVCVLKLNGWPDTFNERIEALSRSVDSIILLRPKPSEGAQWESPENVTVYDLYPERGSFIKPEFLKFLIFPLHVFQAVLLLLFLRLFLNPRDRPDTIHAFDYVLGGLAGALAAPIYRSSLIVSVRGLKEPKYREKVEQRRTLAARAKYYILTLLSGFVLRNADHIVTKSKYQVTFVKDELGVDPGFTPVPTGVDFDIFDPDTVAGSNAFADLFGTADVDPTDQTIILYLASMIPSKGPDRLLEYINEIEDDLPQDVRFVFVGEFANPEFRDEIEALGQPVSERTDFYPHRVSFEKVPHLIASADAVTLFSRPDCEGVPRILQEACAMKTPIIATDVTGISHAFHEFPGCYLVNRDDPGEFLDAIIEVHSNPPTMERNIFQSKFNLYQNYARYAELYESLAEEG